MFSGWFRFKTWKVDRQVAELKPKENEVNHQNFLEWEVEWWQRYCWTFKEVKEGAYTKQDSDESIADHLQVKSQNPK